MPTTVEELPVGFWDDDDPTPAPLAITDQRDAALVEAPSSLPRPTRPQPPAGLTADPADGLPALASLQGLALLQAVFPGRVVKIERTATADDDAAPDEAATTGPDDAPDDDPDPGADAPHPSSP